MTPQRFRFTQVDVFTAHALRGNPLAVVHDANGLDTAQMQAFTDWEHLSESSFLLPPTHPEADYRVRIFCPGRELAFAGHPTLGSCFAWLAAGGRPRGARVVQECGVGLVAIRRDGERLAFAAPPLRRSGPLPEAQIERLARALGLARSDVEQGAWCDNGPGWQALLLRSAEQVLALQPDRAALAGLDIGVVGRHAPGHDATFEVRAFFQGAHEVTEDPVTGSLNAALAQWLIGTGIAPSRYVAAQGTAMGRAGRVFVEHDGRDVWIGGHVSPCIEGTLTL